MIQIFAPYHCKALRYVLDVVFLEFYGLRYKYQISNHKDLIIRLNSSEKSLRINLSFFDMYQEYGIDKSLIPDKKYKELENGDQKLPVFFGKATVETKDKETALHFDLLGFIFFVISGYEELVVAERDKHDRFLASSSFLFQTNFLKRPLVDEYADFLWNSLVKLWPDLNKSKKNNSAKIQVSCDVDQPIDPTVASIGKTIKTSIGDVLKRGSFLLAFNRYRRYFFNKNQNFQFDHNYTFDWYMDECEKANLKAIFYIIPSSDEPNNGYYKLSDEVIKKLLIKINERGHEIGVHSSYQTYKDRKKMNDQKNSLQEQLQSLFIEQEVIYNRQHYLRWDASITPKILNDSGIIYDSSGSYPDYAGFKYGTSKIFSMWDWCERKKLNLKQIPLIVMDDSVLSDSYMGLDINSAHKYIKILQNECFLHKGTYSILWHNSNLEHSWQKQLFLSNLVFKK